MQNQRRPQEDRKERHCLGQERQQKRIRKAVPTFRFFGKGCSITSVFFLRSQQAFVSDTAGRENRAISSQIANSSSISSNLSSPNNFFSDRGGGSEKEEQLFSRLGRGALRVLRPEQHEPVPAARNFRNPESTCQLGCFA